MNCLPQVAQLRRKGIKFSHGHCKETFPVSGLPAEAAAGDTKVIGDGEKQISSLQKRVSWLSPLHLLQRARSPSDTESNRSSSLDTTPELTNAPNLAWKVGGVYPIIPGRLSFTCAPSHAHLTSLQRSASHLIPISSNLPKQYFSFCQDFGPNNLAIVLRFCKFLATRLAVEPAGNHLVFRTAADERIRTNAAFLLAAFLIVENNNTPEQAFAPFQAIRPFPFRGYRDATNAPVTFELSILDCLQGLAKGISFGWVERVRNNLEDYEHWDTPENGDMHQICPKFIAFKGPEAKEHQPGQSKFCHDPEFYIPTFQTEGVTAVVRLNDAGAYDPAVFTRNGIRHYDLFFCDCTAPDREVLARFLHIVDGEGGVVAVHCRAGLGRTGTLIAAWIMARHGFAAREAIAWLRLSRPGSVIGPQQQYLVDLEADSELTGNLDLNSKAVPGLESPSPAGNFSNSKGSSGARWHSAWRRGQRHSDSEADTAKPEPARSFRPSSTRSRTRNKVQPAETPAPARAASELAEQVAAGMVRRANVRTRRARRSGGQ